MLDASSVFGLETFLLAQHPQGGLHPRCHNQQPQDTYRTAAKEMERTVSTVPQAPVTNVLPQRHMISINIR